MVNVLYIDSFDHFTSGQLPLKANGYFGALYDPVISSSAGRGGNGLLIKGLGTYYAYLPNTSTVAVGFAFRATSLVSRRIIGLRDDGTTQLSLNLSSTGKVILVHGDGSTLATSPSSIQTSQWYYLELAATINNTSGDYTFKLDNVLEFNAASKDTQQSSNARVNILLLGGGSSDSSTAEFHYDDLYVTDGTILGPRMVDVIRPNGGVTGYMDMTVVGAGSHYQAIDDTTPDGDTTRIYSPSSSGRQINFSEFENIRETAGAIDAIAVRTYARKEYGNTRGFWTGIMPGTADLAQGGVPYYGDTPTIEYRGTAIIGISGVHYLQTDFAYHSDIYNTNPASVAGAGGTWSPPSVNELKAGLERAI
jgi:hypothetical protein